MKEVEELVNEAFDAVFDWSLVKPKEYKQKELERDIKEAIRQGIQLQQQTQVDEVSGRSEQVCKCGNQLTEKELYYETCLQCNDVVISIFEP